jgi:hypothetical protein
MRAAARSGEAASLAEYEPAVLTGGGIQQEAARTVSRHRFHDVGEVILYLPLRDTQHLGQLMCGAEGSSDQVDDSLAWGLLGLEHDPSS